MQDIIKEWGPAIVTVIAIFLVIGILQLPAVKQTVQDAFTGLIQDTLHTDVTVDSSGN